ncbi:hypothetical protein [Streptomyces sp. NPDC055709]
MTPSSCTRPASAVPSLPSITSSADSLNENFRQKDAIERRALELWRDDNCVEALRAFAGTGCVHALADNDTTLAAMLTVWADKRAAHTDNHTAVQQLLMLAARHWSTDLAHRPRPSTR